MEDSSPENLERASNTAWKWPPNYPPKLSRQAVTWLNWEIDKAERAFEEASKQLPQNLALHDTHLEYLLIDFASVLYDLFLDISKVQVRSGAWTIGQAGPYDFSVIAGHFIRDIGQGVLDKFRTLAVSPENKIEWKAHVFAHSELVFAVLNSIRIRQKSAALMEEMASQFRSKNGGSVTLEKLQRGIAKAAGASRSRAQLNSLNGLIADLKRKYAKDASKIEVMCKHLDFHNAPLPRSHRLISKKTWHEAWLDPNMRGLIKTRISRVKV
jgi:hypothetical protein